MSKQDMNNIDPEKIRYIEPTKDGALDTVQKIGPTALLTIMGAIWALQGNVGSNTTNAGKMEVKMEHMSSQLEEIKETLSIQTRDRYTAADAERDTRDAREKRLLMQKEIDELISAHRNVEARLRDIEIKNLGD